MLNLLKWPKGDTRHIHWEGRAVLWVVRKEEEEKQEERQHLPTLKAVSSASSIKYLCTYHMPGKEGNTGPVKTLLQTQVT